MQCDFWKRKLVTSISANLTRRPWPLFCRRPFSASAMFPFIIFCLSGPCQQVTSFSPWLFHEFEYSNFNAENFVTEVQEALDNLPINPYETLDSGILMLEQCLNEQAPKKKLSKAKQKLSHKPLITPCLLKSIKTKNRLCRALVRSGFSSQKAHAKYKKYRNKVTHLLEIKKRAIISRNFCLVEMILGKCGSSIIPLLVLKKKVRALQRNYLTLSNQTTQAIQKSCPIYSKPTLSQLDSS